MNPHLIYPRPGDKATVYLKNVITNPAIQVGDFTMYHDFRNDPRAFQENNVLYHYPVNGDRLVMGKFCSIACGAVFLFTSANHALGSLSTYPFPIFFTEWGLDGSRVTEAWDNKGDIVLGNDVWVGYEAVILSGVTIGDGAIIAAATLSNRYITDRFLPDKAIDLIDEACALIRTEIDSMPTELDVIQRKIIQHEIDHCDGILI